MGREGGLAPLAQLLGRSQEAAGARSATAGITRRDRGSCPATAPRRGQALRVAVYERPEHHVRTVGRRQTVCQDHRVAGDLRQSEHPRTSIGSGPVHQPRGGRAIRALVARVTPGGRRLDRADSESNQFCLS